MESFRNSITEEMALKELVSRSVNQPSFVFFLIVCICDLCFPQKLS